MDFARDADRTVREVIEGIVACGDEQGGQVAAYLHGKQIVDAREGASRSIVLLAF